MRRALRADHGSSGGWTILRGLVVLTVVGVLAFDGLSCAVHRGLSEDVAAEAARAGAATIGSKPPNLQRIYNGAEAYLQVNDPEYSVIPETVAVDPQEKVVTLSVHREAPTVVFKHFDFTQDWRSVTASGRGGYDRN